MNTSKDIVSNQSNNIPKIPASIIVTGKILQFLSSSLATTYVIKLFKTPIRIKTPERERMMAQSAQQEMLFIPAIKKEVMIYRYGYSKRKVLLIHGWSGRGTQLYNIADKLLENGFMTISFDGPAHGKSTGKTTMLSEFISTTKFLEKKFGSFEIIIGHSTGGMTALNCIKEGLSIRKSIIIGSVDIISDMIKDFVYKLELKAKLVRKIGHRFYLKYGAPINSLSTSVAANDVKIPTLVIHDTDDKEVPVSCAYNIRQNLDQGEILITKGLGHRRILKDEKVLDRIIDFIKRNHL